LIGSFATIIGKALFNSLEVGKASQQLIASANRVLAGSNRQRDAALATAKEMLELTGTLMQVSSHAGETAGISESSNNLSAAGMTTAHRASEQMEQVAESVSESARVVRALGARIAEHMHTIKTMAEASHGIAEEALRATDVVELLAANLGEIGGVFRLGPAGEQTIATHARMLDIVHQAALTAGSVFEQGIDAGRIGLDDLFDECHQPIANSWPQKYHTRFDGFTDQAMVPVQERLLSEYDWLVYAICTDRKSYVPTHNRRFSQPLTGNRETDLANSRTKRIFDDPSAGAAARISGPSCCRPTAATRAKSCMTFRRRSTCMADTGEASASATRRRSSHATARKEKERRSSATSASVPGHEALIHPRGRQQAFRQGQPHGRLLPCDRRPGHTGQGTGPGHRRRQVRRVAKV